MHLRAAAARLPLAPAAQLTLCLPPQRALSGQTLCILVVCVLLKNQCSPYKGKSEGVHKGALCVCLLLVDMQIAEK